YGGINIPDLYTHYMKVMEAGFYDHFLYTTYSKEEFDYLNQRIDHERDYNFPYVAMEQWRGKYLVRDRSKNQFLETPQFAYMLIAMSLFYNYDIHYDAKTRLQYVVDYYDALSNFD